MKTHTHTHTHTHTRTHTHIPVPLKAERTHTVLIPAGQSSIRNFQGLLEWHKMCPLVRVRENILAEVNIE